MKSQKQSKTTQQHSSGNFTIEGHLLLEVINQCIIQFRTEKYQITKAISKVIENNDLPNFIEISENQSQNIEEAKEKKLKIIKQKLILFGWIIGYSPKFYIELLNEEILTSQTNVVDLNSRNQVIIKRFLEDCTKNVENDSAYLTYLHVDNEVLYGKIHELLVVIAKKISDLYTKCVKKVSQELERITELAKKSQLMNSFVMFKLLREVFNNSKRAIEELALEGILRNCPEEYLSIWTNYVIQKFENVYLFADKKHTLEQTIKKNDKTNALIFLMDLQESGKFKMTKRHATSADGQFAIFLKTYQGNNGKKEVLPEDYLIKIDKESNQLIILNCKLIRKKWYVPEKKPQKRISKLSQIFLYQHRTKAYDIIFQNQLKLTEEMRKSEKSIEEYWDVISIDNLTNTGGTIGKCLSMIKKYNGVGDFFIDLSQRALLTESFDQLVKNMPTVGYLLAAGTYTYSFYTLVNNQVSTGSRKFKEISGMTLVAGSTIGSSILGATIGQALIPIPFFGAFVGTIVGGIIGEKSGKKINSFFQNKKFLQIINFLKKQIIDDLYWLHSQQILVLLEIKEKQFQKFIPQGVEDYIFTTMICFVLVCFYESKNQNKFNKEREKQQKPMTTKKIQKKIEDEKKNFEYLLVDNQEQKDIVLKQAKIQYEKQQNEENKKKEEKQKYNKLISQAKLKKQFQKEDMLEAEIMKMRKDEKYEPEFNIIGMINFLEEHKANLGDHIVLLQKTMIPFLTKI